jgi:hypothetical protein
LKSLASSDRITPNRRSNTVNISKTTSLGSITAQISAKFGKAFVSDPAVGLEAFAIDNGIINIKMIPISKRLIFQIFELILNIVFSFFGLNKKSRTVHVDHPAFPAQGMTLLIEYHNL